MRQKSESLWTLSYRKFCRNRTAMVGVVILLFFTVVAFLAPYISPYDPLEQSFIKSLLPPSKEHLFGTDEFGRDLFSRLLYGARISLQIGFISVTISLVIGVTLGLIAGYYGSWLDMVIMRVMDLMLCFPYILLALVIMAILGPGLYNAMIAIGIVYIPTFARIVRSSVLTIKEEEYIKAVKSLGAGDLRILLKHVLINAMAPIIIQATLSIGRAIINAAGLSFLGLGAQPPTPEWGAILSNGQTFLRDAPWVATFPGIAIALLVLGFNLVGDGLRDAFDPKLKR
ncbi:MAG: peptide/nickel transport system permease protein [Halanaerobiales bacterium]|nr:peptide/nickel transport system permease protein [Halanaerobiales bacterium]